ncbi:TIMELESS-interacting protein isoform X2 [Calonectris borealis]|uniref:TIMELESS-interacting protein isoform X2 n=1 Tax=Calonectris borealis TaxID=1323832 RepID=UPI003F4C3799
MIDPLENNLFDLPDYENTEDETFPPLPPPASPGRDDVEWAQANGDENQQSQTKDSAAATRKAVKRPMPKLDAQRLISERGLPALRHMFDNVKFKGKGHETCLKRIRLDLPILHEDFTSNEDGGGESNGLDTATEDVRSCSGNAEELNPVSGTTLTEEQQQRIKKNRQLALERRQTKMQCNSQSQHNELSASYLEEDFNTPVAQDLADLIEDTHATATKVAVTEAEDGDIELERGGEKQ